MMTPGLAVNLPQVGARILRRLSPSLVGFIKAQRLFISRDSFLKSTGYLHSCAEGHPCEPDGSPLPWMNYALIRFLQQRLNPSLTLFEYGSGYSTLFFARLSVSGSGRERGGRPRLVRVSPAQVSTERHTRLSALRAGRDLLSACEPRRSPARHRRHRWERPDAMCRKALTQRPPRTTKPGSRDDLRDTAEAAPRANLASSGFLPRSLKSPHIQRENGGEPRSDPGVRAPARLGGGESGIRTHGRVSPTHAFQACSFNHSDISPDEWIQQVSATGPLRYRCSLTGRPLPRFGRRPAHRRASPPSSSSPRDRRTRT